MAAPLAEPGQRLLARVVDTLVVGVPVILVVRAFVSGPTVDAVAPPALAGCMLVYEAVQLALWGRTLGKRVAGIEVVAATPQEADQGPPGGAGDAEPGPAPLIPASVPGFVPTAASSGGEGPAEGGGVPSGESVPAGARLDVMHAVVRAAVYSLPIALRPIPVLGLLASIFWVGNAGMLFEGTRRQAVHDRLAGTLVVKRPDSDSPAF
ncbi:MULTISPECIES: RDD family protein [Actinomadura]|uniref:RDD family protein n=1 Tax=Actinomadura madurae TaxID=1993 RepID=A0A1I5EN13_9ACTN|nr:RDD family protein [Actinomadura madurae]SFO12849.1 RDD family protein [Actinomadura madurae]SPT60014.1 RDD family [Actinomadura madurae]